MRRPRGEAVLNRLNAMLGGRDRVAHEKRERLPKADRQLAAAMKREIGDAEREIQTLGADQKVRKRDFSSPDEGQDT